MTPQEVQAKLDSMEFNRTLYLPNGYPNIKYILKCNCPYIVIFGGRGTGKTYGLFDFLVNELKTKFIYMRRTAVAMDMCMDMEFNPFGPINDDFNKNILPFTSGKKYMFQYCNADNEPISEDSIAAVGVPLSTTYNLRGFSGEKYDWLYFDEIIREPLEYENKNEGKAFKNFVETCNRNRELKGKQPINCILTGNTDTLDSSILLAIGAIEVVEKMKKNKQEIYINQEKGLAIFDLFDSPISKLKKETSLYKVNKRDKRFNNMAIENNFADLQGDYTIKPTNIKNCVPMFSIDEDIYVYAVKDTQDLYITYHKSGTFNQNFNTSLKEDRLKYDHIYRQMVAIKMVTDKIRYESFEVKMAFRVFADMRL